MTATPVTAEHPAITGRQVTAAVMGNALEFYDFTTYTIFAVDIGKAFFPSHSPFASLMASLGTFGAGFLTRPVGGAGDRGDRRPDRPAAGHAAQLRTDGPGHSGPQPDAVLRPDRPGRADHRGHPAFDPGFRAGRRGGAGDGLPDRSRALEQRGLLGSWQSASQSVSSLIGGAVGAIMAATLAPHLLETYGWRAAFLIGAAVLPFGLIIRRSLPETLHRPDVPGEASADSGGVLAHAPILIFGLASILCFTTSTYVRLYMTTYATTTLHMQAAAAYGASVVNGAAGVVFTLLGGWLSDKYGRKPLMIIPLVAYLIVIYPAFWLMVRNHDAITLWTATGLISALGSMSTGAALIVLAEGLRKGLRSTGMGTVYAVAVALFGGITQPLIAYVIHVTGNAMAPAFYLMATTVVGITAMVMVRETAPHLAVARA